MIRLLALVMALCAFLCGCSPDNDLLDSGMTLRQRLAEGGSFTAKICADFGDVTYSFVLDCIFNGDGSMDFQVISPESISGICGEVSASGGKLTFDDFVLTFPSMAEGEISPVIGPWLTYRGLMGGYIRACSREESGLRLTIDDSFSGENLQLDVWLGDTELPEYAEILWRGRKVLSIQFDSFKTM